MVTAPSLSTRIDDWIYSRLASVAGGRRFSEDTATPFVLSPYVQYSMLSGQQQPVLNGTRLWGEYVYIVQAVARSGNYDDVEAAADGIYTALHQQTGTAGGVEIQSCFCEEEIRRAETLEGGTRYRYLGWRTRIVAIG